MGQSLSWLQCREGMREVWRERVGVYTRLLYHGTRRGMLRLDYTLGYTNNPHSPHLSYVMQHTTTPSSGFYLNIIKYEEYYFWLRFDFFVCCEIAKLEHNLFHKFL